MKTFQSSSNPVLLFFSAAWNCLEWVFKQFQSWDHSGYEQSFTLYSCTPTLSLWGGGHPFPWVFVGREPKTCRSTMGYVLIGMHSVARDQQLHVLISERLQILEGKTDP